MVGQSVQLFQESKPQCRTSESTEQPVELWFSWCRMKSFYSFTVLRFFLNSGVQEEYCSVRICKSLSLFSNRIVMFEWFGFFLRKSRCKLLEVFFL